MPLFEDHVSFAVPATSGQYATARIQFSSTQAAVVSPPLLGVTVLIESAPAGAAIELWLLSHRADPTGDGNYYLFDSTTSSKTWPLASYRGAQLRAKSGGTAGAAIVSATAD